MSDVSAVSRTLRLLSLLQTHRYWVGGELARRLDISTRTLRRDVERLRDLGYRVNANRGAAGGYHLEAGADLPPLVFTDGEAVALALSLRAAASSRLISEAAEITVAALAKLEQVLPARLRDRISSAHHNTELSIPNSSDGMVAPEVLAQLALACRDSERQLLTVTRDAGDEVARRVEPVRLVLFARRWYLICWDLDRDDWRTLRLDRIQAATGTDIRFGVRILPLEDAEAFVRSQLGSPPQTHSVTVVIDAEFEEVAARIGRWGSSLAPADAEHTIWKIESDHAEVLVGMVVWLQWPWRASGSAKFDALVQEAAGRFNSAAASETAVISGQIA
ncbi:MAG: WYL domain-containing protein [Microbacteriaceae bacterium]|nr:WYL domain-containing protein [Microbacteriaceae bacterium]